LEKSINEWLERITQSKDELGGFAICPFAKKAMESNKIYFTTIGAEPVSCIRSYIEFTPKDFEIIVFIDLLNRLTDDELLIIINECQQIYNDIIFLKDHPDNPGYINGIYTGNGVYPIILSQPRKKLEESRDKLKQTKYYDNWDDEYKKEIWSYGYENKID
jgi:hypothetical protein